MNDSNPEDLDYLIQDFLEEEDTIRTECCKVLLEKEVYGDGEVYPQIIDLVKMLIKKIEELNEKENSKK